MSELPKLYDPKALEAKWYAWWLARNDFHRDATSPGEPYTIVIPPPNVTGILHMGHALNNSVQDVLIRVTGSQVGFDLGESLLISKLIDGNYPNYRQVIPAKSKERIVLNREEILTTVKRVSLLATDKLNSVRMAFGADNIEVLSSSHDVGEARESVPVKYSGAQFAIAFNPEFLIQPPARSPPMRSARY